MILEFSRQTVWVLLPAILGRTHSGLTDDTKIYDLWNAVP